jgi:hypothetical protein
MADKISSSMANPMAITPRKIIHPNKRLIIKGLCRALAGYGKRNGDE